jgi:hypothetical protein
MQPPVSQYTEVKSILHNIITVVLLSFTQYDEYYIYFMLLMLYCILALMQQERQRDQLSHKHFSFPQCSHYPYSAMSEE